MHSNFMTNFMRIIVELGEDSTYAGWMIWGLISANGNRFFSSPKNVQTSSGDHPASYSMGTWEKSQQCLKFTNTSVYCWGKEWVELYLSSPYINSWYIRTTLPLPLPFLLLCSVISFQTGHNLTLLQLGHNSSATYSIICSGWKVWKCDC